MTTIECSRCNAPVEDGAKFCLNCGQSVSISPSRGPTPTASRTAQRGQITLGRAPHCTYMIDKPTVSAQHAMLEVLPGG